MPKPASASGIFRSDVERGVVFVPTGSAAFDFYGADRIGDDLFANCLIALNAETGERLWHFQIGSRAWRCFRPDGLGGIRFLWRRPHRRRSVRKLPDRPECRNRRAPLAF